jgi:hypothetical protein
MLTQAYHHAPSNATADPQPHSLILQCRPNIAHTHTHTRARAFMC